MEPRCDTFLPPKAIGVSIGPTGYRSRAGGARDVAFRTMDGVTRRLLFEIADGYDQMADILERITAVERLVRKRSEPVSGLDGELCRTGVQLRISPG